jgi:DNA polymerase-1
MTGDLDTLQLVQDDKVVVFTLRKGVTDTFTYNQKEVVARYGLEPSQIIDFKGLKGDPSDNIPGVPGIGEKTASSLIQEFGSMEKLYEALEKGGKLPKLLTPKLIERLTTNKDQALFSKRLSTIIRDVDISFDLQKAQWREHYAKPELEKLLKDLALYSIVKRLGEIDGSQPEPMKPTSLFDVPTEAPKPVAVDDGIKTTVLGSADETIQALAQAESQNKIILDIQEGMVMFGFGTTEAFGFPETLFKNKKLLTQFKSILESPALGKIGHDIKRVGRWALGHGITLAGCSFDTRLAAYLLSIDVKDFLLERLYFVEFDKDLDPEPLKRPAYIAMLQKRYEPKLKESQLTKLQDEIELPLSPVLARMERAGIKVDPKVLSKLSVTISKEIDHLEKKIAELAGGEFNINSPKQLSVVLFDKLELKSKVRKTGKGALSTAHSELEKLAHEHPIIELILKYRELQKLKGTYIEPFPALLDTEGRVHTTYNQIGAATGRMASLDPNLQNIPIRTEVGQEFRKAFIAEKGYVLLSCDYSQLELRIAAHLSGDPAMSDAFKRGEDIHTRTASRIFGVEPSAVTKSMRNQAKTLNFGVLYGMGLNGFQRAAGVNRDEAKKFIDGYNKEFAGLTKYMEGLKQMARKNGYVETLFGRRRPIPEILSTMPMLRAGAERMAINMPIQGTEADLLKIAMINVQKHIDEKYGDDVRMLLQVHDELLFEVKKDIVEPVAKEITKIMESAHQFDVPIVVDAKCGDNWAEMVEIK